MRYSGKLGVSEQKEVRDGIWEDVITEYSVLGTVEQTTGVLEGGDNVLPRASTTTSITVPGRSREVRDNSDLRYITYKGIRWQIERIVDNPPMIVIYIGEVYNGPHPE